MASRLDNDYVFQKEKQQILEDSRETIDENGKRIKPKLSEKG